MRLKKGDTTIKKLIFFSASLSIVALGAVWMMLFQEPIADTMTKAPPPKKRALAYEQALAVQLREEAEAADAEKQKEQKAKDAGKDATKTNGVSESTASAMVKNSGAPAANQAAPQQNAAALPQPAGQPQAAPGAPADSAARGQCACRCRRTRASRRA